MNEKHNTIQDIINELKRLQVEHGDIPVFTNVNHNQPLESWPFYNEKENRIEF